ncbi:hypothetical protein EXW51_30560 (plasmid) [Bacillus mycoides]|nr:hypothetical protein EXW51_30560 [Bacillus mycoides]
MLYLHKMKVHFVFIFKLMGMWRYPIPIKLRNANTPKTRKLASPGENVQFSRFGSTGSISLMSMLLNLY